MDTAQQEPTETDGKPTIQTGMQLFIEQTLIVWGLFKK